MKLKPCSRSWSREGSDLFGWSGWFKIPEAQVLSSPDPSNLWKSESYWILDQSRSWLHQRHCCNPAGTSSVVHGSSLFMGSDARSKINTSRQHGGNARPVQEPNNWHSLAISGRCGKGTCDKWWCALCSNIVYFEFRVWWERSLPRQTYDLKQTKSRCTKLYCLLHTLQTYLEYSWLYA